MQRECNGNFKKRKNAAAASGAPTPRTSNYQAMWYACACVGVRTMQSDAISSNCKDYRKHGYVNIVKRDAVNVPSCPTCLCRCTVEKFTQSNIQGIAMKKARATAMEA